ncbi:MULTISPECIES: type VII secretion protein EccB [unclassified Streptomyces]|uniref:type VII secretion protein EccB n=1 Tax=unclassified Streptomyces TaxID=2593676 RepID=UPI00278C3679|nr:MULTISPECIES: type VII secretion protein EccB [unclassified Streptomyces]
MASRRDELNAYNFARKRTVAAFLKPLPNGSVDSAPRPLKHAVPGIVMAAVVLAGFGACGMISPVAPKGWDTPEAGIIVTDPSATRYVVLKSDTKDKNGKPVGVLHPVLNLASAKLLLDPKKTGGDAVKKVKEKFLDESNITQGSMVGIPYAPDRMPTTKDAGTAKTWALCQQPSGGSDAASVRQTVFVLDKNDASKVTSKSKGRLGGSEALYVQDKQGKPYLVSSSGVSYPLTTGPGGDLASLITTLFGADAKPQTVSDDWLGTLREAPVPISLPSVNGLGNTSSVTDLPAGHNKIGTLIEGAQNQKYLVEKDRLIAVTDFEASLLKETVGAAYPDGAPTYVKVQQTDIHPTEGSLYDNLPAVKKAGGTLFWPKQKVTRANSTASSGRNVSCSTYEGDGGGRSVWAGGNLPIGKISASASSYVSPGSGMIYQEQTGTSSTGFNYLVTDTGLRYYLPVNNDSDSSSGAADKDVNQSKARLGYGDVTPVKVPGIWSQLLPSGPDLTTKAAEQTQNS